MKRLTYLITYLFISLFTVANLFAQNECNDAGFQLWTQSEKKSGVSIYPPWESDESILESTLQQNKYDEFLNIKTTTSKLTKFLVPINVFIYRDNAGNNGISAIQFDALLQECNRLYANSNTGIQFYINKRLFYNSTSYNSGVNNYLSLAYLFDSQSNADGLNIYVIGSGDLNAGVALTPDINYYKYKVMIETNIVRDGFLATNLGNTLAHELGHSLGLYHTHHPGRSLLHASDTNGELTSKCYQEFVDRNYIYPSNSSCLYIDEQRNCKVNGDFLCDTPADPNLSQHVTSGCAIISLPIPNDILNNPWNPDVTNLMSYSHRDCRNTFTRSQIAAMWYWLTTDFFNATRKNNANIIAPNCISTAGEAVSAPIFSNTSYNWFAGTNLSVVSTNGGNAIIKSVNNSGVLTNLMVNLSNSYLDCTILKQVYAGTAIPAISEAYDPNCNCTALGLTTNKNYYLLGLINNNLVHGVSTNYQWTLVPPPPNSQTQVFQGEKVFINANNPGLYTMSFSYNGACGWSVVATKQFYFEEEEFGLTISPNPADTELIIEIIDSNTVSDTDYESEVQLLNQMLISKKIKKEKSKIINLNVSDLPSGLYYLKVTYNKKTQVKTVIIE